MKSVGNNDDDDAEHGYTIRSSVSGSGELKMICLIFPFAQNIDCGYTLEPNQRTNTHALLGFIDVYIRCANSTKIKLTSHKKIENDFSFCQGSFLYVLYFRDLFSWPW